MSAKERTIKEIQMKLHEWPEQEAYLTEGKELIKSAARGLQFYEPHLIASGEGGAYLLRSDDNQLFGIFKPFDEDPFSNRNPKSLTALDKAHWTAIKTHQAGRAAHREVAAYLLDHQREAGVPLTVLVSIKCSRWGGNGKIGSLQRYEAHDHDSWELSPSLYDKSQVHKIALLDLRILNTDRHGGNILVRKTSPEADPRHSPLKLIPIDHGLCLPNRLPQQKDLWFEWMSWPQAKMPIDDQLRRHVFQLDLEKDANLLRGIGLCEDIVDNMLLSSAIVQQGVMKNFTPYKIAKIITKLPRPDPSWQGHRIRVLLNEIKRFRKHLEKPPIFFSMVPSLVYRRHCSDPHLAKFSLIRKDSELKSINIERS